MGQQAIIRVTFHNQNAVDQPFVIIVEVRDEDGVTVYLAYQSNKLAAGKNYTMGVSWIPTEFCNADIATTCHSTYQIRRFVVDSLENPTVLTLVDTLNVPVTQPASYVNKIYKIVLYGREHEISYSLNYGDIGNVSIDRDLATISVQLENVIGDSKFTIGLPRSLVDEALGCGLDPAPTVILEPEVFVDTIPSEIQTVILDADHIGWQVELEAGAEVVEFVGSCAI